MSGRANIKMKAVDRISASPDSVIRSTCYWTFSRYFKISSNLVLSVGGTLLPNNVDAFPFDSPETIDANGDEIGNNADLNDDISGESKALSDEPLLIG